MMAQYVDLFLFDIKHIDSEQHAELTGVRNEKILENLKRILNEGHNVKIRMPILKGLNDSDDILQKTMEFLTPFKDLQNFKGIDILPYHKLGINKYTQLDMEYPIKSDLSFSEEDLNHIESLLKKYDIEVNVVKH